ncbi:hypothetical protein [Acetivibrio cellulolyticus]|uniref:hypothetical protein n=1 Tax=Acetivibrio cellulolyticus TaxID=35830 RepID=UPI0001E2C6DE|nr:hypothetical protein [Acetivibrio cellulolyticus]
MKKVFRIIVFVFLVISTIVFGTLAYINDISAEESDYNYNHRISMELEKVICCYLVETEDLDLTFGGKPAKSVEDLILNLEKMEYIKLESYKPMKHRFFGFFKVDNLGWRIVVNKKRFQASISVSEKDELIFMEY